MKPCRTTCPGVRLRYVPVARIVDHALIGVGVQNGEEVQVIDPVFGDDLARAVIVEIIQALKAVQRTEHDAV